MAHSWPELSFDQAKKTYQTLHLWTQIVGKIKLAKLPWINHSWHVTLLPSPHGLTSGDLPDRDKHFQLNFDFNEHALYVLTSAGERREIGLRGLSVAGFYRQLMAALDELGIRVSINRMPNELPDPTPFDEDEEHATYDPEHAKKLHTALLKAAKVFTRFRSEFIGKCSPVHFFWGSFDLAVSRFSGRTAPLHPGGIPNLPDWVAQEAYSHEVSSCGFWPGDESTGEAMFYNYIYPEPEGCKDANVAPEGAYYHPDLREFVLPYAVVQRAENPEETLLAFLRSTYAVGADLALWDRAALEKELP